MEMEEGYYSYASLCGVLAIIVAGWLVYKWMNPPCNTGRLPPGSMGFPLVGETFRFFKPSPSIDIPAFYKQRLKRYGPLFKTNLVGQSLVVSMDAEVNRFIFQQEGKLFRSWYPDTTNIIFGEESLASCDGSLHKFVRSFAARLFGVDSLRDVLLAEMEQNVERSFAAWATEPQKRHGDFLDEVVDELQSGPGMLNEKFAIDLVGALLFASFATVSSSLTVAMKFLSDQPSVVEALKEEHEAILKKREGAGTSAITWDEYKSMTFTAQVTNEIVRLSNVAPGIFRKTLTDVQVKGYTIPAGWLVMISPISVNLNPELYEDPLAFDPWRWQDESKKSTLLKNFMPFGGGLRLCVGAEFSRIQIALFLHTLVTKYRWKEIRGGEVQRISEIVFPKGYHIQIIAREG